MSRPDFDFDADEIVQQPGDGPRSLKSALARIPDGPAPPETMLNRDNGKSPAFFDAAHADALRKFFGGS